MKKATDDTERPQQHSALGLRSTTYHRVHQAILADIVNGSFKPGTRLKIAELCKRYDLSAMPIREALQQLQGEGIVVISPNKGASVRPIDKAFVTDIYDVRGALYSIIYRDAIQTATTALDTKLVDIQTRFDDAMRDNQINRCRDYNLQFHATIEAECHNREVVQLIAKYSNLTQSLRDLFGYDLARLENISQEHWRILKAFQNRDVDAAVKAAKEHSFSALDNMARFF
jgi:DNA-binding GntR family transcriptional regulator